MQTSARRRGYAPAGCEDFRLWPDRQSRADVAGVSVATRPRVVVHVAVSLDGATSGFSADVGAFYGLAATWHEDAALTGADTVLAQEDALREAPHPGPSPTGPILAVVDSRARVRHWQALRNAGYWSDVIALRAQTTPQHPDSGVLEITTGSTRVDLATALRQLFDRGAAVVRVDSGGALTGALLSANLVDEVSLLVHPCLSDRTGGAWYGAASAATATQFELIASNPVDQLVWLRYRVT
jgi:2,5-diamino-6-(ribosylamino)-4(3H)-pyrimidinone 5'-phosphate reductase